MDFKNIENEYKPLSLWSWNEKLDTSYTLQHVSDMNSIGIGSFCVSAQSGLSSRYMGDDWFRNISFAIERARESGLSVWVSDENGYPSGSGNGIVNSTGLEYQQKILRCEVGERTNDRTIICTNGYHLYYDINPCYIDVLNKDTVNLFLCAAYEPYAEKFGNEIEGIFSFEPQLCCNDIPWSFSLPAAYKDAYGEELLDVLPQLFYSEGDYKSTRIKFWKLVTKLFSDNFIKPIHIWCKEKNITYSLSSKCDRISDFTTSGDAMIHYMNTDIPAIEVSSKEKLNPVSALSASSVAQQFGKKDSMAFLLTKSGHGTTFSDLKQAASAQFARGISKISLCGNSSSLRGLRKRTVPSYSYLREDLFPGFAELNNYISRVSKALSLGEADYDTLLISNQTSLWTSYDGSKNTYTENTPMLEAIATLEKKHIPFHIGDELIMQEYAYVDRDTLCVGNRKYKTVVLSENAELLGSTEKLLSEFEHGGGFITIAESLPENTVCNNDNLLYSTRTAEDCTIHYFYNASNNEFTSAITVGTKMLNLSTGEVVPFHGVYKFSPFEALITIEDDTPELPRPFKKALKSLDISSEWNLEHISQNALMLDKCDVYIDGVLTHKEINVTDVTEIAYGLKTQVNIECIFKFNIRALSEDIFVVCETPHNFSIKINDMHVEEPVSGSFIDSELQTINISKYVTEGENYISVNSQINPSDEVLNSRELATNHFFELSRINYDIEFEPLYITGNFSVRTDGEFRKLDRNAYRYIGDFSIDLPVSKYYLENLHKQGLIFFAGEITLSKILNLSDTQYALRFVPKGISMIQVMVNGQNAGSVLWAPYELDLSGLLIKGDNEIKLIISTPHRNLFGPHHAPLGELYTVNPGDFYMSRTI